MGIRQSSNGGSRLSACGFGGKSSKQEEPAEPQPGQHNLVDIAHRILPIEESNFLRAGELLLGGRYTVRGLGGCGAFGEVYFAYDAEKEDDVAIKVLPHDPFGGTQSETTLLTVVKKADKRGRCPIVRFDGDFMHKNLDCLVFERLGADMYEVLRATRHTGIALADTRRVARCLLRAFVLLLQEEIVHCDVKPENVLVARGLGSFASTKDPAEAGKALRVKLIDFGSARQSDQTPESYMQSRFYRAPDVMLGQRITCAVDMWSLGCVLVELLCGDPLFPGQDTHEMLHLLELSLGPVPQDVLRCGSFMDIRQFYEPFEGDSKRRVRNPSARTLRDKSVQWRLRKVKKRNLSAAANAAVRMGMDVDARVKHSLAIHGRTDEEDETELRLFVDLVRKMLVYSLDDRIKPLEALQHPFFAVKTPNHAKAAAAAAAAAAAVAAAAGDAAGAAAAPVQAPPHDGTAAASGAAGTTQPGAAGPGSAASPTALAKDVEKQPSAPGVLVDTGDKNPTVARSSARSSAVSSISAGSVDDVVLAAAAAAAREEDGARNVSPLARPPEKSGESADSGATSSPVDSFPSPVPHHSASARLLGGSSGSNSARGAGAGGDSDHAANGHHAHGAHHTIAELRASSDKVATAAELARYKNARNRRSQSVNLPRYSGMAALGPHHVPYRSTYAYHAHVQQMRQEEEEAAREAASGKRGTGRGHRHHRRPSLWTQERFVRDARQLDSLAALWRQSCKHADLGHGDYFGFVDSAAEATSTKSAIAPRSRSYAGVVHTGSSSRTVGAEPSHTTPLAGGSSRSRNGTAAAAGAGAGVGAGAAATSFAYAATSSAPLSSTRRRRPSSTPRRIQQLGGGGGDDAAGREGAPPSAPFPQHYHKTRSSEDLRHLGQMALAHTLAAGSSDAPPPPPPAGVPVLSHTQSHDPKRATGPPRRAMERLRPTFSRVTFENPHDAQHDAGHGHARSRSHVPQLSGRAASGPTDSAAPAHPLTHGSRRKRRSMTLALPEGAGAVSASGMPIMRSLTPTARSRNRHKQQQRQQRQRVVPGVHSNRAANTEATRLGVWAVGTSTNSSSTAPVPSPPAPASARTAVTPPLPPRHATAKSAPISPVHAPAAPVPAPPPPMSLAHLANGGRSVSAGGLTSEQLQRELSAAMHAASRAAASRQP